MGRRQIQGRELAFAHGEAGESEGFGRQRPWEEAGPRGGRPLLGGVLLCLAGWVEEVSFFLRAGKGTAPSC